ncbi:hypothetical protein AQS8620_01180 [Aquimixticola soesokkakensis]|uniref:Uncharacterized protein n=1 Tax=Aquimixticola soesokkakensis TaxID=1519096 RepID=A0A1Y5SCT5_9RHOB|nr:DUF3008 family protein [Aquimixticola soesokkakensis]SLN35001.1 hypothetical protein AQS8620_01180 [Aquimixticola soesokkakensis]
MKAKSEVQQKAAGAALSAKRGETTVQDLWGASRDLYENLSEGELAEMAAVDHDAVPHRKAG